MLQSLTAASPDELTRLIRQIKFETQILGFTADESGHHCYFRCMTKIRIVDGKISARGGVNLDDKIGNNA